MRVLLFSMVFMTLCVCTAERASALYEFCPADVRIISTNNAATAKIGFELAALGPRSVSATIAFDTTAGWFTVAVPQTALVERDRQYKGPSSEFMMRDWVSPIMYMQFPKPVTVLHRWVMSAQASGDQFGWAAKGRVMCEPFTDGNGIQLPSGAKFPFQTTDIDESPKSAASNRSVITAQPSQPIKTATCASPFTQATPLQLVQPKDLTPPRVPLTTTIEVAIEPDGDLADAWVWGPSGDQVFDATRLDEVKKDTFRAGTSYCEPAAGFYFLNFGYVPR